MSDIFQEIDEDIRQDRLKALWQQYAPYVIFTVAVIILTVAGRAYWIDYVTNKEIANSEKYDSAIEFVINGDNSSALSALEEIVADDSGYSALAQFQIAAKLLENNDKAGALAIYDALANDGGTNERLRGLSSILAAATAIDVEEADMVRARIEPLSEYGSVWYFPAQEILALLELSQGNSQTAIGIYSALVNDHETPAGISQRAGEILSVIDVITPILDEPVLEEQEEGSE